ncbi:hypothetical protein BDZ88DRAFT_185051 [Geranomyces variabilis]|nr:hypothetical protein BDZ88DRAFT_185051 [Geranomyces variabilis]
MRRSRPAVGPSIGYRALPSAPGSQSQPLVARAFLFVRCAQHGCKTSRWLAGWLAGWLVGEADPPYSPWLSSRRTTEREREREVIKGTGIVVPSPIFSPANTHNQLPLLSPSLPPRILTHTHPILPVFTLNTSITHPQKMVNALIATAAAAVVLSSFASAAPYRSWNNNYGSDNYKKGESYDLCRDQHQAKTWYDDNGVQYGWDNSQNKACLIKKGGSNKGGYKHKDNSYKNDDYSYKKDDYSSSYNGGDDDYSYGGGDDDYSYGGGDDDYSYGGGSYTPSAPKKSYFAASYDDKNSYGKDSYGKDSYGKDSYGKDDSYGSCKNYAKTYEQCSRNFARARNDVCGQFGSSGTKHGECLSNVAAFNDKCIRSIDHGKPFCYDDVSSGVSGKGYSGYSSATYGNDKSNYGDDKSNYGGDKSNYGGDKSNYGAVLCPRVCRSPQQQREAPSGLVKEQSPTGALA